MAMCLPMNSNVHQNAVQAKRSKQFFANGNTNEMQQRNFESKIPV